MAAPALLGMPIELLVHIIATYLSTTDLGALRLTNRFLERALFDSFAKEFFAKKQFMLTTPSLNALNDISKHAVLSKVVKHVIIGLEQYKHVWHPNASAPEETLEWEAGLADQFNLTNTGRDRDLLAAAFRGLPNLETVGIRDYSAEGRHRDGVTKWHSYGSPTVQKKTKHPLLCHADSSGIIPDYPTKAYALLLQALAEADRVVPAIEIIIRAQGAGLKDMAFFLPEPPTPKLERILHGLRTLLLTLNFSHVPFQDPVTLNFTNFIAKVPKLTHLRLNFEKALNSSEIVLDWLADKNNNILPHLKELDFGMMVVSPDILFRAVARFAPTLRSVSLWKIDLVNIMPADNYDTDRRANVWRHFLMNILNRSGLNLTSLSLGCIAQLDSGGRQNVQFIKPTATEIATGGNNQDFDRVRAGKGNMEEFLPFMIDDVTVRWPALSQIVRHEYDDEEEDDEEEDDDGDGPLAH